MVAVDDSSKIGAGKVDDATRSTGDRAIRRATRRPVVRTVRHWRDRDNGRELQVRRQERQESR
jgi:hypothetical protein